MPKLQKSFELEINPEQFLQACSLLELKEVELLLDSHIRRAEEKELRRSYSKANLQEAGFTPVERSINTDAPDFNSATNNPNHP